MNIVRNRPRLFLLTATLFILAISVAAEDTTPRQTSRRQLRPIQTQAKAAPSEEAQAEALRKAIQNPFASLISVPPQIKPGTWASLDGKFWWTG